jgi:large subunit ribosomal protein L4e
MGVKIIDIGGKVVGEIELPKVFSEVYRPDLIKRAVLASQANRLQPYGSFKYAGLLKSARYWGTGFGVARVPRIAGGRRAAIVPQARGGRRAHPPKPEKVLSEKINKKERLLALKSAIAATANPELVSARGHIFEAELPVVAEGVEELSRTKEVVEFLKSAGLYDDVKRAKDGIKIRAGKGKMRGRRYKKPKSVLFVTSSKCSLERAARNLPGVDVVRLAEMSVEDLAPGTHAGRLTVWSLHAIERMQERGW